MLRVLTFTFPIIVGFDMQNTCSACWDTYVKTSSVCDGSLFRIHECDAADDAANSICFVNLL